MRLPDVRFLGLGERAAAYHQDFIAVAEKYAANRTDINLILNTAGLLRNGG